MSGHVSCKVSKRSAIFLIPAKGVDTSVSIGTNRLREWDLAKQRKNERAEAYLVSCTAVRSAEVIDEMERELGRPVVTSNQAIAWYCLRKAGIQDQVPGFGALLCEH